METFSVPVVTAWEMRPFQWSHGFSTMETLGIAALAAALDKCFNGATVFQPWRRTPDATLGQSQ